MYLQKVAIKNIRSIREFEMTFQNPAGWHVLIGDNGAGKSSIIRAIAAALIGPEQIAAVLPNWQEWLTKGEEEAKINLELLPDRNVDKIGRGQPTDNPITNELSLTREERGVRMQSNANVSRKPPTNYNWSNNEGWFSVAYGPFRRFTGGDNRWNKVYYSAPKAGAHLSVFGEDVALTEALDWLKELDRMRLKERESRQASSSTVEETGPGYESGAGLLFENLKTFINISQLLPHEAHFDKVDIDGNILFADGAGAEVKITEMSDGYRSILSLTFELIRQLVTTYGAEKVFPRGETTSSIDLPGVVLIDEIDAHLHPTWQTRIGAWFTRYFPNIQFIVTTHSPLVCRAAEKGSIWRLATPSSGEVSGEITGNDRKKLLFGNILDAYGTEVFGESPVRGSKGDEQLERLGKLNMLFALGTISDEENSERLALQQIHSTDAPTGF
ncbi:MAG: AAA family ATPase [Saprospiraceae bacterium]|nr:AAA family ATPase [Saprospiraceae bacterium]